MNSANGVDTAYKRKIRAEAHREVQYTGTAERKNSGVAMIVTENVLGRTIAGTLSNVLKIVERQDIEIFVRPDRYYRCSRKKDDGNSRMVSCTFYYSHSGNLWASTVPCKRFQWG